MTAPRAAEVEILSAAVAERGQRAAAGWLREAGLRIGDRIAFCLPSSADLLTCVLGALRSGVVPVMVNPSLLESERRQITVDSEPALVVDDARYLERMLQGPAAELAPYPMARPMHYTSGTTGSSKGVWSGILSDSDARDLFEDEADLWAFDAQDVHLVCSPMHHSVSIRFAAAALLRGGTVVVLSRFDAATAVEALLRTGATTTFMAPTSLYRLLGCSGLPHRLDGLRLLVHAGSPCPAEVKRSAMALCRPGVVWEFYGSTEGQFTVCPPDEWSARPGTVGRARSGRILDVRDGVVWCKAPPFARFTYWRNPGATSRAWHDDEFTVGDLGHIDEDGYLYLDGRREDLVITGGVNVYPAEVEAVLCRAPGVEEVAVFGMEDREWGQRVCAAVTGRLDEPALREFAAARLAPYKRPKTYFLLRELPHTSTGKLRRRDLAAILGDGARTSASEEG